MPHNPLNPRAPRPIPTAAPPANKPAGSLPKVPVASPTATLQTSIASAPIPAHSALFISLLSPSGAFLSSAVKSSSPRMRSLAPKSRGKMAISAGIGNWKTAQVQRGATRQATPSPMRMMERALIAPEEGEERGSVCCSLASFGGRRGLDWAWAWLDEEAIARCLSSCVDDG